MTKKELSIYGISHLTSDAAILEHVFTSKLVPSKGTPHPEIKQFVASDYVVMRDSRFPNKIIISITYNPLSRKSAPLAVFKGVDNGK